MGSMTDARVSMHEGDDLTRGGHALQYGKSRQRRLAMSALKSARIFLLAYLFVLVLSMFLEEWLIFPAPRYPEGDWSPRHLQFEDVEFESADGTKLHGWYFEHPAPQVQLLYCHGNGNFVPALGDFAHHVRQLCAASVFVFDYRGYGKSSGAPNEKGGTGRRTGRNRLVSEAGSGRNF